MRTRYLAPFAVAIVALGVLVGAQAPTNVLNPASDLAGKTLVTAEGNRTITGTFSFNVPIRLNPGTTNAPGVVSTTDQTTGWQLTVGAIGGSLSGTQRFLMNASGLTLFGNTLLNASGQLSLASLSSGTSGGIPYYNSANSILPSAVLVANDLVQGGGAGVAPSSFGTKSANCLVAGPTSGAAAIVSCRSIDALDVEPLYATATAQFDKTTDTALANVTGLSLTLTAAKTYHLRGHLRIAYDATGGWKLGTGGTATATTFALDSFPYTNSANTYYDAVTALGTFSNHGSPGGTAAYFNIDAYIVVNAGGTFTIQFAQNGASGTSSVLVGSWIRAE